MTEDTVMQVLVGEFHDKLAMLDGVVRREASFHDASNKIKVAMGMRRSGKTYFLFQQMRTLLASGVPLSRILYINFEDDRLLPLDRDKLAHLVEAWYSLYPENHDVYCYLFLDEIQNVSEWPVVVRRLHDTKKAEIFLSGSSSKLLSKEIASSLRGRSLATEIWPFSFSEFMVANDAVVDKKLYGKKTQDIVTKLFRRYLGEGGFPEVTAYEADVRIQTLQQYIDIVLYRDIVERHAIKNPALIKYMILSLIHNVGTLFSINKFYNEVKGRGYKTGKDVLYEYAEHIEDAYVAFFVPLYNRSMRKVQTNPKKVYAIDPGMVRAVTLNTDGDWGRIFENIVYLDLRRRGCTVSYYITKELYEIDFVAVSPNGTKTCYQVVWDDDDTQTADREQRAITAASQELNIDGHIITCDSYLRNGIPA